jgi:hypothetical protein
VLRVINADATPEEIAALMAVLLIPDAGYEPDDPRSVWPTSLRWRQTIPPAVDAWRYSGLCLY